MVAALTLALSGPCNNLTDLLWVPLARTSSMAAMWIAIRGDIAVYRFFAEGEHVRAYATIVPSRIVRAVLRRLAANPHGP